jgi:hypothetical protein
VEVCWFDSQNYVFITFGGMMHDLITVYCDESCHLQNDKKDKTMVIGAIWGDKNAIWETAKQLKSLRIKHRLNPAYEFKWTKISRMKAEFYSDIVKLFFREDHLHLRCIIIPDKSLLRHAEFNQTHDDWYYKMFYLLAREIVTPNNYYNIYLDYKDTWSNRKCKKLEEVLRNQFHDSQGTIIHTVQPVRSHEVEMIQLCDLFIGAMTYSLRGEFNSPAKKSILNSIENGLGHAIEVNTNRYERKFNVFEWRSQ